MTRPDLTGTPPSSATQEPSTRPPGTVHRTSGGEKGTLSGALRLAVGFVLAAAVVVFVEVLLAVFPDPLWTAVLLVPPVLLGALVLDSARRRRASAKRTPLDPTPKRVPTRRTRPPAADPAGHPTPGEAAIAAAVDLFNRSPFLRTVAGIAKSLGPPMASVVPLSGTSDDVRVTIAWELSWYQYLVSAGSTEPVRLHDRGEELEELEDRYRAWNARVGPDGRLLHERSASG